MSDMSIGDFLFNNVLPVALVLTVVAITVYKAYKKFKRLSSKDGGSCCSCDNCPFCKTGQGKCSATGASECHCNDKKEVTLNSMTQHN